MPKELLFCIEVPLLNPLFVDWINVSTPKVYFLSALYPIKNDEVKVPLETLLFGYVV